MQHKFNLSFSIYSLLQFFSIITTLFKLNLAIKISYNNADVPISNDNLCKVTGCFKEHCTLKSDKEEKICNYNFKPEFVCYKRANCIFENGNCKWEQTKELEECLLTNRGVYYVRKDILIN